jgi:hypothetical protein
LAGTRDFLFSPVPHEFCGSPRDYWVGRAKHETGHSPPSKVRVKNTGSYNFIPSYIFMLCCLILYIDGAPAYASSISFRSFLFLASILFFPSLFSVLLFVSSFLPFYLLSFFIFFISLSSSLSHPSFYLNEFFMILVQACSTKQFSGRRNNIKLVMMEEMSQIESFLSGETGALIEFWTLWRSRAEMLFTEQNGSDASRHLG